VRNAPDIFGGNTAGHDGVGGAVQELARLAPGFFLFDFVYPEIGQRITTAA